jgi:DNA-binding NtrC family response regulator
MPGKILIVDDEQTMCEMIAADLVRRGFLSSWSRSAEDALRALQSENFDVVLTDLRLPGVDGIEFCRRILSDRPEVPVIVITAFGSLETAVDAIRAGAFDFVTKPFELDLLAIAVERALGHRSLKRQVKRLSKAVRRRGRKGDFVGESPAMQALYEQIARIADTEASVLICGESGSGKELVARALHDKSSRQAGPFVALNCAALPANLIESELFGHTKGAFTDARENRRGLLLQAGGGTLFLDEIADLPIVLQPKLLRALEERTIRPLGSDSEQSFDARLLCATRSDLQAAVLEGRFREDLYFRINVIQIDVPPLRARGTDILLLAQDFLDRFGARSGRNVGDISPAAAKKLLGYSWPGNVRELRNAVEHATALANHDYIDVEDLPERIRAGAVAANITAGNDLMDLLTLDEVERRHIQHVLEAVGGSKTKAADILGLDRKTLYRKLQRYERE